MKNKYAIAAALTGPENEHLFGLRNSNLKEYKDTWSLPSTTISKSEFHDTLTNDSVPEGIVNRLVKKTFFKSRKIQLSFLRSAIRIRTNYCLNLALVEGKIGSMPEPTKKYQRFDFCTIDEVLQRLEEKAGTCVSLLIQELIERDELDSAVSYLEISPKLADSIRPLTKFTPKELWKIAMPNYVLLREGMSGSDGEHIRSITLDRYLKKYLEKVPKTTTILDLGCGGGRLVYDLTERGYSITGVDLLPDPLKRYPLKVKLIKSQAKDIHKIFLKNSFSLVIMNLVVPWLENLELVTQALSKITLPNSKILVTIVPPEFAKNGHWEKKGGTHNWIVTKPLRRDPTLVMVNRTVGPVWYFPRTTPEYINIFARKGFLCLRSEYLFVDSLLSDKEIASTFQKKPYLRRHLKLPVFLVMEFISKK